ncbi:MAG: hypothetical protein N2B03_06525, partial [Boseongicola sp.]
MRVTSGSSSAPTVFVKPDGKLTVEVRLPDGVSRPSESALFLRRCRGQGPTVWRQAGGKAV